MSTIWDAGITVMFPAYNDAPSLPQLLARTFDTLRRVATDYEVIVVNDGSSDDTAAVLADLAQLYRPFLRVITHPRNGGYGAALRSGFAAAAKEYIFYTDGDGQYDPGELELLLHAATPDAGLVNGYKIARHDPVHRVLLGWLYNGFARWLFRVRLRDIDCDFRLIRRSALDPVTLHSTGGTICVELVRGLELSGFPVIEVPVHHYPRRHGRSQFFRLQSLAVTWGQLFAVFLRLVASPWLRRHKIPAAALFILLLAALAYARALQLPLIADDYVQIHLSLDYGPPSKWGALAGDALYRCRATSLLLTYWTYLAFGLAPLAYNLVSLGLHMLDSLLVLCLGLWRPVGWKLAAVAAAFFAVSERHSEAVVWFSALPELLVFFFSLASFLCFIQWVQSRGRWFYLAALGLYLLALLSKESGVVVAPLCVLAVFCDRSPRKLWAAAPFLALAIGYFALILDARDTHLHFHDGTFSLAAPFVQVLIRSAARLLWVWCIPALLFLAALRLPGWRLICAIAAAWMVITLLPYSFLTYMPRVPSRHTYLASAGAALIVAAGWVALNGKLRRLAPWLAAIIIVHQCGYLWTVKHRQYAQRAEPTEQLIQAAKVSPGLIYAKCFPYSPSIAELALRYGAAGASTRLITGPEAAQHPGARDFCNESADGVHF